MKIPCVFMVMLVLLTAGIVVSASAQDYGVPDSVYFFQPTYQPLDCFGTVRMTLPLHLYSDDWAHSYAITIFWRGQAVCDTVLIHELRPCDDPWVDSFVDSAANRCGAGITCQYRFITPGSGTVVEFVFRMQMGDTLTISPDTSNYFIIGDWQNWWYPTYMVLEDTIFVPDTLAMMPGDADCTGSVDISDPVFLISYIFAGGSPPYDLNSADVNADCSVDISDAVYLIGYIFSGGSPPQPGCAIPTQRK